jgi:hypothetical protein
LLRDAFAGLEPEALHELEQRLRLT